MTDTLVTVLMPVRNASAHIVEAVDSIRRQTEQRFRLLVIDDGSTDDGLDKVAAMNDGRISIVRDSRELGIARRLNWGIDQSQSAFIARMDADDVAEPDRLATQVEFLRRHPDIAICGSFYRVSIGRSLSAPVVLPTTHEALRAMTLFASPFAHPTVMFSAALIDRANLRYSAEFSHAEDYELWERAAHVVRLGNIPEALLRYRVHPHQVSSRHAAIQRETSDAVRRRALERLGIAFTDKELALHCECGSGAIAGDLVRMAEARQWLGELAARVEGRYPAILAECGRRQAELDRSLRNHARRNVWWRKLARRLRGRR